MQESLAVDTDTFWNSLDNGYFVGALYYIKIINLNHLLLFYPPETTSQTRSALSLHLSLIWETILHSSVEPSSNNSISLLNPPKQGPYPCCALLCSMHNSLYKAWVNCFIILILRYWSPLINSWWMGPCCIVLMYLQPQPWLIIHGYSVQLTNTVMGTLFAKEQRGTGLRSARNLAWILCTSCPTTDFSVSMNSSSILGSPTLMCLTYRVCLHQTHQPLGLGNQASVGTHSKKMHEDQRQTVLTGNWLWGWEGAGLKPHHTELLLYPGSSLLGRTDSLRRAEVCAFEGWLSVGLFSDWWVYLMMYFWSLFQARLAQGISLTYMFYVMCHSTHAHINRCHGPPYQTRWSQFKMTTEPRISAVAECLLSLDKVIGSVSTLSNKNCNTEINLLMESHWGCE